MNANTETGILLSSHSIEFELVDGLILIPITVNLEPGIYILDSGTPSLIVNSSNIQADVEYQTINRVLPADLITVDHVSIGPLQESNLPALEMDLGFVEDKLNRKIDGIIGSEFIRNFDLLLDYENRQLIFLGAHHDFDELISQHSSLVPLDIINASGDLPIVEVQIDGQPKKMALDTGAPHNVLHDDVTNGAFEYRTISLNSLRIESAQFRSSDLSFLDEVYSNGIDGILSIFSLNATKVIVSLKRGKLYLVYDHSNIQSSLKDLTQVN